MSRRITLIDNDIDSLVMILEHQILVYKQAVEKNYAVGKVGSKEIERLIKLLKGNK